MASSGAATGAFSGRSSFNLRVAISSYSVDEANNRAVWIVGLRIDNPSGGTATWSADKASYSVVVNGVTIASGTVSPFDFRDGAAYHDIVVARQTPWIQYGWDGRKTISFSASISSSTIFGSASASGSVVADPISHPAPTGLAVTRVSDTQQTLNWSRPGTYSSVLVQRRTDDGAWQQVGAPSGNAYTFTDTTTSANHKYEYRVAGVAGNAQSGWSASAVVYTSPAAPTGVAAARSGLDIVVSASTVPPWATSFEIRDGATVVATGVSLPWTHVGPNPAAAHQYTVRGIAPGSTSGAWSTASNAVQLIAPPNAPMNLTPNGSIAASDANVVLTWTHNPVDASPQASFEVRHRAPNGAWTTIPGATAPQVSVTLPVGNREWQVRTKGADPAFSPWSAVAVVTVIDRPGVAVTQPDGQWDASVLTAVWSWFQAQSRPQSAWQLELLDGTGQVIEYRSGTGPAGTFTVSTRLSQGDWSVRVRAATGDVWSGWAVQPFTVTFDPPATPVLSGDWSEETGVVTLTVNPGEEPVDAPATVRMFIERATDTGWETVLDTEQPATSVDAESPSYGDVVYRATSFTVEGASAVEEITVPVRSNALWLSGGPGFTMTARLPLDPTITITGGRERTEKQFAGRSKPVAYVGEALIRTVAFGGEVADRESDTASSQRLEQIVRLPDAVFLFRDPDGKRIYGSVGSLSLSRTGSEWDPESQGWYSVWGYSLTLTEAEA